MTATIYIWYPHLQTANNINYFQVFLTYLSIFPGFPEGAHVPDSADHPPQHHARAAARHPQHPQTQPLLLRNILLLQQNIDQTITHGIMGRRFPDGVC